MKEREKVIEELKVEVTRAFKKGKKVSKADIGRVLDACLRKQGYEHLFETRVYRNYGSIYCYLLELINEREKKGMLYALQEEMLKEGSPKSMYGVTIPTSQKRVDIYIYKTKEEAQAQGLRKETVIRRVRLREVNEKGYKKTLKTMRDRAYKVEKNIDKTVIKNRVLTYLVDGEYRVEIV